MKKVIKCFGVLALAAVLSLVVYIPYLFLSYSRIPDNEQIIPENSINTALPFNTQLRVSTFNVGYGAYSQDYTFFMDGGKESLGRSPQEVENNINHSLELIKQYNADIMLFQEVDIDADRSYNINEYSIFKTQLQNYNSLFAINYDSAYLFYPFTKPIGKSKSGIIVFSNYTLGETTRRSLPISESLAKFVDLDRCYTVTQMPVENGKNLWVYNVHLSAYGSSEEIANSQLTMLFNDATQKTKQGDYVIIGGDFNHDVPGNSVEKLNETYDNFSWCQPLPRNLIPDNFLVCDTYTNFVPTCRNVDVPYEKGSTFVVIIDGFIISNNIECVEINNIETAFESSDHSPVVLDFVLL